MLYDHEKLAKEVNGKVCLYCIDNEECKERKNKDHTCFELDETLVDRMICSTMSFCPPGSKHCKDCIRELSKKYILDFKGRIKKIAKKRA